MCEFSFSFISLRQLPVSDQQLSPLAGCNFSLKYCRSLRCVLVFALYGSWHHNKHTLFYILDTCHVNLHQLLARHLVTGSSLADDAIYF